MKLDYAVLFVRDLDRSANFFERYFDSAPPVKLPGGKSFLLLFEGGGKLMLKENPGGKSSGIVAFCAEDRSKVEQITGELDWDGYEILKRPSVDSNGNYSARVSDKDGNIVEIISD